MGAAVGWSLAQPAQGVTGWTRLLRVGLVTVWLASLAFGGGGWHTCCQLAGGDV